MGQFSSFDALPIVVHDGILRSLASPRDVTNLIRASPGSLQAYMTGGRKSVLLATMQNFLSLENQHLMNLVMAAPQTATASNVELDGVTSRDDFHEAVRCFLESFHPEHQLCSKHTIQHLSLNTLDSSITLFAVMDKAIRRYSIYTLARSQFQVDKLLEIQAVLTSSTDWQNLTPDDRETQRVWRGFLLYELFCIIWGMPQISEYVLHPQPYTIQREFIRILDSFFGMPAQVLEEFLCVRQYVGQQYEGEVNQVVQRFRLAALRMGRRSSDTDSSDPLKLNRTPSSLSEPKTKQLPDSLRYLCENLSFDGCKDKAVWVDSMALIGPSFLQDFLSQDATARLDFFRATFPQLSIPLIRPRHPVFVSGHKFYYLAHKHLGLTPHGINNKTMAHLRAVGWIFWDNPDRLSYMHLVPGHCDEVYGRKGESQIPLRPEHPAADESHLDERPKEPEVWEPIVREFGTLVTQDQHEQVARLFTAVGSLRFSEVTSVVNGSRDQTVGGDGAEVSHTDD